MIGQGRGGTAYLPSRQYTSTAPLEPEKTAELAQQKKQGGAFAASVRENIGKSWKVLLPIQLDDARHEYLFNFTVRDVKADTETYDTNTYTGKRKPNPARVGRAVEGGRATLELRCSLPQSD